MQISVVWRWGPRICVSNKHSSKPLHFTWLLVHTTMTYRITISIEGKFFHKILNELFTARFYSNQAENTIFSYSSVYGVKAQKMQKPHKAGKIFSATAGARKSMTPALARGGFQVKEAIYEHPDSHFH